MKALTHHQNSAKLLARPMSKAGTRSTHRDPRQISVGSERLEDHVDTVVRTVPVPRHHPRHWRRTGGWKSTVQCTTNRPAREPARMEGRSIT